MCRINLINIMKPIFILLVFGIQTQFLMSADLSEGQKESLYISKKDLANGNYILKAVNDKGELIKCIKYRVGEKAGTIECFKFANVVEKEGQKISEDNFERLEKLFTEQQKRTKDVVHEAIDFLKKKLADEDDFMKLTDTLKSGSVTVAAPDKVFKYETSSIIVYSLRDKSGNVTQCSKITSGQGIGRVSCKLKKANGWIELLPNYTFDYLESKYNELQ